MFSKRFSILRFVFFACVTSVVAATAQAEEFRTWTDSTGRFKLQAKLVSVDEGKVTLLRDNGQKMTIELKKLSKADQEYVVKSDSDNPFQATEETPFVPVQSGSKMSTGDGPRTVSVDWSRSTAIPFQASRSDWNISPPEMVPFGFSPKPVSLPRKTDFFEKVVGIAINPVARKAVVGYTGGRPGVEGTTRIVMCDIEHGRVVASATAPSQMAPLALHDDGRQILMRRNDFGFGNLERLEVWTITGKDVVRSLIWTPYADVGGSSHDVMWAEFLDADTLATASRGGKVAVWNFASATPICHFQLSTGSLPALSSDRKWIGFCTEDRVGLFDVEKQEITVLKETPSKLTWPFVAFSPTGQKLGCIARDRILVWDTASGRLERDFATPGIVIHGAIDFPNDGFILANNQYLIALESQIKLCQYVGAQQAHTVGGTTFLGTSDHSGTSLLAVTQLPHAAAAALLDRALQQPDLFVFREGAAVKLDVSGIPSAERKHVKEALTKKLTEMKCTVDDDGTIDLVASVEGPKQKEMRYMHSGTYKVQEYRTWVKFVYKTQSVWETSGTNIPRFLMLKRGENIGDYLRERSKKPSYEFYDRVVLPRFLQKPSENQRPGAAQTLGVCQVTPTGFR